MYKQDNINFYTNRKNFVDGLMNRIMFWKPEAPFFLPKSKAINSTIKIGLICENTLYKSMLFEGEVYLLTPYNWKKILTFICLDIIIIESITESCTGHWGYAQLVKNELNSELIKLINFAKIKNIPTVFWNTKDYLYYDHYKTFSNHFEFLYFSDINSLEISRKKNKKGKYLPPAVQPAIYNPFLHTDYSKKIDIQLLFDGITDICRMEKNEIKLLKNTIKYGLKIIESHSFVLNTKLKDVEEFEECILGCTTFNSRVLALKYSKQYLMLNNSLKTKHLQEWIALEVAACRIPIIFFGNLSDYDTRNNFVIKNNNKDSILELLFSFKIDDLYRERSGHLAWRHAIEKNTYSHRIQKISKNIGINHDWKEFPKASLIAPTFRKNFIERIIDTYNRQKYQNKELVIVYNNDDINNFKKMKEIYCKEDISFINLPKEHFSGNCLNLGIIHSKGDYIFRIDDDDYYGDNYISDMILHQRGNDFLFFGKRAPYFMIEKEKKLYCRKHNVKLEIASANGMAIGSSWLAGNTISGKRKTFIENPYPEVFGSADTALGYQMGTMKDGDIGILDTFNMAFSRREDLNSHTWRASEDTIKKNSAILPYGLNEIMI